MKALLAMPHGLQHTMFSPAQLDQLRQIVDIDVEETIPDLTAVPAAMLSDIDVLITGWGSPRVNGPALERMPRLRAVVHTAGTLRRIASEALWERGDIIVTTAAQANAIPVAEFALAQILLAGKRSLAHETAHRRTRGRERALDLTVGGNHGAVIGLIGASRIGAMVAELLRPFSMEVLISDPFVDAGTLSGLGATKVELPELFRRSDVVSLHAPDVPGTRKMITAELLSLMRDGTTFVNTARPALVDLDALRPELLSGRLSAALDVHDDLAPDDPLWDVPTVSITPHIAGSLGNELHRMAGSALEEMRRLRAGEPALAPVDRERLSIMA